MNEDSIFHKCLPGQASVGRVAAWKCDHCDETHIVIYLKCMPPEYLIDEEPFYGAINISESVAQYLVTNIPVELENPAPGLDGSISLPMAPF